MAQSDSIQIDSLKLVDNPAKEKHKKEHKVQISPIPYINYSQSQKFMYGLVGILTFKMSAKDTISPKSTVGASYIRTTRGTWFTAGFAQLFFDEDKWRVVLMAGTGTYNFQTYLDETGIEPGFYDYGSDTDVITARVLRKIYKKNYLGLAYFYNRVDTKFSELPIEQSVNSNAFQLIYLNDTRDGFYFPTHGNKAMVMVSFYPTWVGNNTDVAIVNANFNKYFKTKRNDVIAARAYAKFGTGSLDFQRQVVFGQVDLRGYASGKYRGDGKFDVQGEYRYNFRNSRLGLVGFGGLGTLYGAEIDDFNWKLYPSIGAGFRYLAVKSTGMRFGMDVARGKDEWAFYFRIGESF